MDGGAGPLYGAAELERHDAQYETQQGDGQPDLGHQLEPKGVLYRVECHENSKAAQVFTHTHCVCGGGLLFMTTICGPGPALSPVRTDVAHLRRLVSGLEMSEGDADIAAQVLSGRVGDHNRHNSRGDLKGGMHSISFMSRDLIKGPVNRYLKVPVAQQCSQSKTRVWSFPSCYCPVSVECSVLIGQMDRASWSSPPPLHCNLCVCLSGL